MFQKLWHSSSHQPLELSTITDTFQRILHDSSVLGFTVTPPLRNSGVTQLSIGWPPLKIPAAVVAAAVVITFKVKKLVQ